MEHTAGAVRFEGARIVDTRSGATIPASPSSRTDPQTSARAVPLRSCRPSCVGCSAAALRGVQTSHPCDAPGPRTPWVRRRRRKCSPRPSAPRSRAVPRTRAGCRGRGGPAPRDPTIRGLALAIRDVASSTVRIQAAAAGPEIPNRSSSSKAADDVLATLSNSQNRPQRGGGIRRGEKPRLEGAREALAEMRRQIEKRIDHGMAWKNAASGTPRTGTTSARSR